MDNNPTQTTQQTAQTVSTPSNPNVVATTSRLADLIAGATYAQPTGFDQNLFTGAGDTTKNSWAMGEAAANDPSFNRGVQGGINSLSKTAAGDYVGSVDPTFEAALGRATNGVAADVNASIGADGRYGSNIHVDRLANDIGNMRQTAELGNLQQQKADQLAAIPALTNLFSAKQLPASVFGSIGAAKDANTSGLLAGQYDQVQRRNNLIPDWIAKLTSAAAGNAANAGTSTTTNSSNTVPTTPWWLAIPSAIGSVL